VILNRLSRKAVMTHQALRWVSESKDVTGRRTGDAYVGLDANLRNRNSFGIAANRQRTEKQ
jgi:hypothetical protein